MNKISKRLDKFFEEIDKFAPNPEITWESGGYVEERMRRDEVIDYLGYHFPCREGILEIMEAVKKCYPEGETGPLLCIGSGKALTEYAVSLTGTKVIATDPCVSHGSENILTGKVRPFMEVEKITAIEAIEKYPTANCFMTVWPTYRGEWTGEFVEEIVKKKNSRTRIIYIGEGEGGCTGNKKFHELLSEHFTKESRIQGETWIGIDDSVHIWGPKSSVSEKTTH